MNWKIAALAAVALVSGCSSRTENDNSMPAGTRAPSPAPPLKPVPKERPTIDPKSSEAAELLTAAFVRLLNQHRFEEAYMLLGPHAPPRAQFQSEFERYSDLKVIARRASDQEGAAGSIYVSVPLDISGRIKGQSVSRSGKAVLRRINDVPGSTERQRRWHIERIDWDER